MLEPTTHVIGSSAQARPEPRTDEFTASNVTNTEKPDEWVQRGPQVLENVRYAYRHALRRYQQAVAIEDASDANIAQDLMEVFSISIYEQRRILERPLRPSGVSEQEWVNHLLRVWTDEEYHAAMRTLDDEPMKVDLDNDPFLQAEIKGVASVEGMGVNDVVREALRRGLREMQRR